MSNLDTTRRNFYKWHYENQNAVSADIADWWLAEIESILEEKRKQLIKLPRYQRNGTANATDVYLNDALSLFTTPKDKEV